MRRADSGKTDFAAAAMPMPIGTFTKSTHRQDT